MPGSPTTPGGGDSDGSWLAWWSFNHDAYLSLAKRIALARTRSNENGESRAQLVEAFREHAQPVLEDVLGEGDAAVVLREVLQTVGRLADEPDLGGLPELDFYSRHFLALTIPSLHSGALLALGMRGDASDIPFLRATLAGSSDGREAQPGKPVAEHERVLAAYSLGLLASSATRVQGLDLTADLLDGLESESMELRVAAALALGLTENGPCEGCDSRQFESRHICAETVLEALSAHAFDAAERPEVRAHATSSIGRLSARAGGPGLQATAAGALLGLLGSGGDPDVLRSAVTALGTMAGGLDAKLENQIRARLQELVSTGEPTLQRLALVAMAEAAGRSASRGAAPQKTQACLIRELAHGKRALRPWAALALGILGHGLLGADQDIKEVVLALRRALEYTSDPGEGVAAALALGILRQEDPDSARALLRLYRRSPLRGFAEPATLALGLLHAQEARELLLERFQQGDAQAAVALILLGEREVGKTPRTTFGRGISPDMLRALSLRPEPETVAGLSKLLADRAAPAKTRAAAAAALGDLLDLDRPHWSAAYANGLNYFALTRSLSSRVGDALLDGRPRQ